LAPTVDLRPYFSPIENQGQLGSCTANAAVSLVEYFEKRAFGTFLDASRLFVYKTSRDLLGWKGDTGSYLRTTMGALVLFGTPPERYWPYDGAPAAQNTHFDVEPSAFCYAFANNYQAIRYLRLDTAGTTPQQLLVNIKTFLAAGFPSMFGFPVYREFMFPNSQGQAAFPTAHSTYYGGHAISAAGYDDNMMIGNDKGALLIRNSWGTSWGLNGYAWLSYRYVTEGLAVDWWTLIQEKWVNTGIF
jgi:C1A family cysteine protease